jgi:protein TIF31
MSPSFGKNLEIYINSILNTEPYFLTQPPLPIFSWISQDTSLKVQKEDSVTNLVPLFGLDPKGIRDWNEEFQVVKDFPKATFVQRIQRDRAIQKVYNDFLDAAIKGAVAIVNGNLMPLNPNETEKQQVFVYNYIFFSYSIDLIDSFKDLTSADNNPSFT